MLAARFYGRARGEAYFTRKPLVLLQKTQAVDLKGYLFDPTGFFGAMLFPSQRCFQSTQDVDDRQLPHKFSIPWQLELEAVDDLLRHEVVAHVPTDPPVQRHRNDISRFQVH